MNRRSFFRHVVAGASALASPAPARAALTFPPWPIDPVAGWRYKILLGVPPIHFNCRCVARLPPTRIKVT